MAYKYNHADPILTVINGITSFFGLNLKNFDRLYSQSEDLRDKVDKLAEEYLRKYEDKLAVSTPSTSPSIAKFVRSQLEKDKDTVLAIQRQIQLTTDQLARSKNEVQIGLNKRADLEKKLTDTVAEAKEAEQQFKANQAKTSAIIRGAEDRFTNAMNYNKWKEKNK